VNKSSAKPKTPDSIKSHVYDYNRGSWRTYSLDELGVWVHLLCKRSRHRASSEKKAKDLEDAQNYLNMMQAHLDFLKGGGEVEQL
jgi:hypothetical protein